MSGGIEQGSILQGLRNPDRKKKECNPCPRSQPILTRWDGSPPRNRGEGPQIEAQDICDLMTCFPGELM